LQTNLLRNRDGMPPEAPNRVTFKTSLNAYSFSRALTGENKDFTFFDLLDYCAEQGFDGIDPTGYFFPGYPSVPSDAYVNAFKRRAYLLGLAITGTGVRNNLASPDKEARAADVQHIKKWIKVSARLGAPVMRVFAGKESEGHSRDEVANWMVEDLKVIVEHAEKFGVIIGIQNHGDFLKTSGQVLEIVERVNSEWFGTIVDTGYFLEADPYEEIAAVAPYAVNWQVKEKVDGQAFEVNVDMDRVVQIAHDAGYRGYLPIETLFKKTDPEYDPQGRATQLLRQLEAAIGRAG
jgi:sugar phosphate isomerase/epimerase